MWQQEEKNWQQQWSRLSGNLALFTFNSTTTFNNRSSKSLQQLMISHQMLFYRCTLLQQGGTEKAWLGWISSVSRSSITTAAAAAVDDDIMMENLRENSIVQQRTQREWQLTHDTERSRVKISPPNLSVSSQSSCESVFLSGRYSLLPRHLHGQL